MAKYLVTGGCGYIGYHLVNHLLLIGHSVRVLDKDCSNRGASLRECCEIVEGDVNDLEVLEESFRDIDGCFHLAGTDRSLSNSSAQIHGSKDSADPFNIFQVACSAQYPKPVPIVYASTRDVYGDNADMVLSEHARTRPFTPRAVAKLSAEFYARIVALNHHLPTTGLRLFDIYGPADSSGAVRSNPVADLVEKVVNDKPIYVSGNCVQTLDLVYIEDVCRFFVQAMNKIESKASIFNVCSGKPISLLELVDTISSLCNTNAKISRRSTCSNRIQTSIGNPFQAAHDLGIKTTTDLSTGLREVIHSITSNQIQNNFKIRGHSAM